MDWYDISDGYEDMQAALAKAYGLDAAAEPAQEEDPEWGNLTVSEVGRLLRSNCASRLVTSDPPWA